FAIGETKALQTIEMLHVNNMHLMPDSVHDDLMALVRRYTLTGGMPGCIQSFQDLLDPGFRRGDNIR
ncbi:MAG: hypothetical protein Q8O11_04965, partial [Syntrophales bacterium]|nr:hypothetical protein [Syntrophales bacterium]